VPYINGIVIMTLLFIFVIVLCQYLIEVGKKHQKYMYHHCKEPLHNHHDGCPACDEIKRTA